MKPCRKCHQIDRNKHGQCRPCQKDYDAERYAKNSDKKKANAAWKVKNHEKENTGDVAYRAKNSEKIKCARDTVRAAKKTLRECTMCPKPARPEKTMCEECGKKHSVYVTERQKNHKLTRLAHSIRSRLRHAIKNQQKCGSLVRNLGMTVLEFYEYFKQFFFPNPRTGEVMTWENWGRKGWHIDHIRPLASFDLEDRAQFLIAVHYTNLQPLWAEDNLKKGAQYDRAAT